MTGREFDNLIKRFGGEIRWNCNAYWTLINFASETSALEFLAEVARHGTFRHSVETRMQAYSGGFSVWVSSDIYQ